MKWLEFITSKITTDPFFTWMLENLILLVLWFLFLWLLKYLVDRWATKEMAKHNNTQADEDKKFEDMIR
jgi:divalent metal cation (Fe/Co/Zn/Cd) transporter